MEEYQAKKAQEERTVTRFLLWVWIAEMVWASFFAMKMVAYEHRCSVVTFVFVTMFFALNYIIPLAFTFTAFVSVLFGKPGEA